MKKNYVDYGNCCGTSCGRIGGTDGITGCRFSLAPMSDQYINIILGSIAKVNTEKVFVLTDSLSTVYRGKRNHVLDAMRACFTYAFRPNIHMTMEATFSKGCPGDTEGDSFLDVDDVLMNENNILNIHFPVTSKISLYPMGIEHYMPHIATIVNEAVDRGIYKHSAHYVTVLECDVAQLFDYYHYILEYCTKHLGHYVLQATISVNSPTKN